MCMALAALQPTKAMSKNATAQVFFKFLGDYPRYSATFPLSVAQKAQPILGYDFVEVGFFRFASFVLAFAGHRAHDTCVNLN